ncbi:MAG TPA: DNA-formamidopyrimidine glycosylase family protein [Gordonia sp. (in: high G+C Gram-positive bacteria)]|uniref:Fpg/Nei family DNA glycosylase n=1 Tax=unclassified Gordonia (in: high G+C Gram-positive bacteria) TaxID=2657482 RepID=UPI0025C016FC|nr:MULTISPECIES: DNA-formamidopyrimidine glycosylase family protein [unclassified Gordonia (in: high G+C Gram-positive bacteria)]HNP58078.1 DNA-formamidopyrimidine glycosylase family protein [Gordonia sp. (in: high G+C Gram-positive bacteria)]HRC51038.1 DNA-formamidopyrimidine glycosylase family protein [Gordonia sp. (in: high G+C Gram-positive bacteria)]
MPELPEVTAIADFLDERMAGLPIRRVDVASLAVLKTADPPYTALVGRTVASVGRIGKYLVITTVGADDGEPLHLVIHLSRAGWVRWSENLSPTPPRPGGKGPIALRVHAGLPGEGFDVTEAGTQKRLAVWVVTDPLDVERIAGLGPDALALSRGELAQICAGSSARIKNLLTDQRIIAGIGNAYSDEILHRARLSPFATAKGLSDDQLDALHSAITEVLRDALARLEGPGGVATMKAEKRSGLQVHARTGLPCPVCGDTVAQVAFADRSFQYCPTCQTGGKKLADRRMSRLLK